MRFKFKSILPLILSIFLVASSLMTTLVRAEEFVISGNGAGSDSQITATVTTETTVTQTNNAEVTNNVDASATTGANEASGNSGDASITTGDIHEDIAVENTLNASSVETPCCPSETFLEISGNGTDSQNLININQTSATNIGINNYANIQNNIGVNANSGGNSGNNNGGSVSIDTGNIIIKGNIKNGPVNNYNISASIGNGGISAKVLDNENLSKNSIFLVTNNSNNTTINSIAKLGNIVFVNTNTGKNEASGNMGDVSIKTGDISVDFTITNDPINIGGVDFTCCDINNPPPSPSPSPIPTPKPGDSGNTPYDPGNPNSGGSNLSSAGSSGGSGGPQILGLSFTGSARSRILSLLIGIMMLVGGTSFLQKQIWQKRLRLVKAPK